MADQSNFGWRLVSEYLTDELAENSEDERWIHKAKKAAGKKQNKKLSKKRVERGKRVTSPSGASFQYQGVAEAAWRAPAVVVPPSMQPVVRPLGPCHNCGEIGHLKRTYLKPLGTVSPSTKYPSVTNVECPSGEERESEASDEEGVRGVDDWLDMWFDNDRVLGEVVVGVKGRLREKCEFWESTLQASDTIISIIKQGYVLPLTVVPDSFSKANHESAISETRFVDLALQEGDVWLHVVQNP